MSIGRATFIALIVALSSPMAHGADTGVPETARAPYEAMQALAGLHGEWRATTELMNAEGDWIEQHQDIVSFSPDLGGVLLTEREISRLSGEGFSLITDFSFDQYRKRYRAAVIGTGWGLMDIYEGVVADGVLEMDNLRSGTTFKLDDGRGMHFRLSIPLTGDDRLMTIEQSLTAGEAWSPFYRIRYQRN